jgi:hypothetical protein
MVNAMRARLPALFAAGLLSGLLSGLLPGVTAAGDAAAAASASAHAHTATLAVSVTADAGGRLWLAREQDGRVLVSRSDDGGARFGNEVVVNAVAEKVRAEGQNRPQIAVHGERVAVAWSQALEKRFSGHVRFARSTDGGRSFLPPVTVNDDRQEIGHGFTALAMHTDGRLAIAWLDARDSTAAKANGTDWTGSSLYYVLSSDGGETFTPNARLAAHTCQCCRIALAFAPDGVAVALWRHVFGKDTRDFAMARLEAGSRVLRASKDGWHIDGCPHHGGALAIDARGRRHLAWFTAADGQPGLHYRRADGKRMTRPMAFGDGAAQAGHPAVFARDDEVWLAWREFAGDAFQLRLQSSQDGGSRWSAPRTLATATGNTDLPLFVSGSSRPLLYWNTGDAGLRLFPLESPP